MGELLQAALQYRERGFSVIPVKRNKKPCLDSWKLYQEQKADLGQIRAWWKQYPKANVAIVTGEISGLDVVDVDSPKGLNALNELLPDSIVMPIARTPGGGWHHYHEHREGLSNVVGFLEKCDFRTTGGYIIAPPSLGSNGRGYTWVENLSIAEVDPCPLPDALYKKISLYIAPPDYAQEIDNQQKSAKVSNNQILFKKGHRDHALFHLANHLVKAGMPTVNIEKYLSFLASHCSPPFPQNEIQTKIQSALKRVERKKRNIAEDVRKWVLVSEGHFLVSDYHLESGVVSSKDKHAVIVALQDLEKKGIVEKYGSKRGCYRRVDTECEAIDWESASDTPFDMQWPFGLEELVLMYPKNICVIAGVQNSGKTAVALNLAHINMDRYKVRYVSSEFGDTELKGRLRKFDYPLKSWRPIDFRERSSNFADVILPDGFNIIDFYEISDKFWLIAEDLKQIYQKLAKGIAVVCLQKTEGKSEGRGGDFGLEKPRLYLNLDPAPPDGAVLTIRKAKFWAVEGKNPNYYKTKFKIVNGSKLIQQGNWYLETR